MTGVAAYVVLVVVLPALLLGHQGQDWPLRGAWRGLYARWSASRARHALRIHPAHERAPHAPLWAHSQPLAYEETA